MLDCRAAQDPQSATSQIEVMPGVSVEVVFEITAKGNGVVELPGVGVRVYDCHDDGLVFRDSLLRCEWRDFDRDGALDFVVTGVGVRTHEKTGAEQSSLPLRGVFRYVRERARFEVVSCSADICFFQR